MSRSGADGDEGKAQSLPAYLSRSAYAVSALDQDEQLGRLKRFFEAHSLHEADPTGAHPGHHAWLDLWASMTILRSTCVMP